MLQNTKIRNYSLLIEFELIYETRILGQTLQTISNDYHNYITSQPLLSRTKFSYLESPVTNSIFKIQLSHIQEETIL